MQCWCDLVMMEMMMMMRSLLLNRLVYCPTTTHFVISLEHQVVHQLSCMLIRLRSRSRVAGNQSQSLLPPQQHAALLCQLWPDNRSVIQLFDAFLADHTNGHTYATMLSPSICLSLTMFVIHVCSVWHHPGWNHICIYMLIYFLDPILAHPIMVNGEAKQRR